VSIADATGAVLAVYGDPDRGELPLARPGQTSTPVKPCSAI